MTASVNVYVVSHKIIFIVVENLKLMQRSPSHRVEEARMKGQKETKQKEAAQQHQNCPWLPATVHRRKRSWALESAEEISVYRKTPM